MLYGITHTVEGLPIVRLPKAVKIGIGCPKGIAIHVWIAWNPATSKAFWRVEVGAGKDAKVSNFATRKEAETFYNEARTKAPDIKYPRKLSYFTFLKPMPDGTFTHDFDAIERHGVQPRAIDIVFLSDTPFRAEMQMWGATELKCHGDGLRAQRVISMASTDEEKQLAKEAKDANGKFFPVSTCFMEGCPYSLPSIDARTNKEVPPACKIGTDLEFQLANDLRVGAKAYFHSTGFRTTSFLFSSLESVKLLTGGRLLGVPMKLVVQAFKASHNGIASTQYSVHVEFRAEDIQAIKKNLIAQAFEFRKLVAGPTVEVSGKALPALAAASNTEDDEDESPAEAAQIAAEFFPSDDGADDEPATTQTSKVEEKTTVATESLKAKLAEQQQAAETATEPQTAAETNPKPALGGLAADGLGGLTNPPADQPKTEQPKRKKPFE